MRTQSRKDSVLLELENLVAAALFMLSWILYVVFLKYIFQLTPLGGEHAKGKKFSKNRSLRVLSFDPLRALSFDPLRSIPFVRSPSFDPFRSIPFVRSPSPDLFRSIPFARALSPDPFRSIPSEENTQRGKFSKKLNVPREDNWSQIITQFSICRLVKPSKCSLSTASNPSFSLYAPLWSSPKSFFRSFKRGIPRNRGRFIEK